MYFVFFLSMLSFLTAEIREIRTMAELPAYLDEDTVVLFDLDNTIMETAQTLGSDQWFIYRWHYYENLGHRSSSAFENALAEWTAIQNLTKVRLVEKEIASMIADMQASGQVLMGLTTRGMSMALRTIEQLKTLQVDLSKTAPVQEEILFNLERGVLFRHGILFTAGTSKGEAFYSFFKDHFPKRVVFIDDKEKYLRDVEKFCDRMQIPFVGLRYSFLDEKVKSFSPEVAALQWEHFGSLISDDEAVKALRIR